MQALKHLSRVTIESNGQRGELWLQVPNAGFELAITPSGPLDESHRLRYLSVLFAGFIESIDGEVPPNERRLALASSPASIATLLELRAKLYEDMRLQGRVLLACPHCAAEADVDLVTLALVLGPDPWPLADASGLPTAPSLATPLPVGTRPPGSPRASSARLLLPSARLSLQPRPYSEALLQGRISVERELEGRRRWSREDEPFEIELAHRIWSNPGFRAIVRMTLTLARLDDTGDLQPEMIESMPITDFLFVDAAYHYLQVVPISDPEHGTIECPACQGRFLPVL